MRVPDFMHEMRQTSAVFGRTTGAYVTFEGDRAYTDGKRINLPSLPLDKSLTTDQVLYMRGYVDHEAGHLRHSDMKRIVDFYKRCLNNDKEDLKNLHNCVEDVWMEGKVMKDYHGSRKNLKATHELIKRKELRIRQEAEEFVRTGDISALKSLSEEEKKIAKKLPKDKVEELRAKQKEMLGQITPEIAGSAIKACNPEFKDTQASKDYMDSLPEKLKEWAPMWAEQAAACKDTEECITLAKSIYKLLKEEDPELESSPEDFDPTSGEGMEEGEPGDVSDEEAQEGQGSGKPQKGEGSDKEGEGEGGSFNEFDPNYMPSLGELMTTEPGDGGGGIGACHGDFVGGYSVFSTESDVVYERNGDRSKGDDRLHQIVNNDDPTEYTKVRSQVAGEINTMSAKLRRGLMAKDRRDWDFGKELGRLDTKRLVSGTMGNPNVYKQRCDREEENTAVTFLIDLSGSMSGRKAHVARDCMVALSECLGNSQMPFKVVGFCNRGYPSEAYGNRRDRTAKYHRYERLDTVVFKGFEQPLRTARGSISNIHRATGGNNTDYDFIQQELSELRKRTEARKVLFVLSDGHPAHMSDASTSEIIRHCKTAISTASKDGVECIGIGICDRAVKQIYKDHVVVDDVNELAGVCFTKLTKLLLGNK